MEYFQGTFDGNNKIIDNLYINNTSNYQGLFGDIEDATIKNLIIDNSIIQPNMIMGSIAGYAENCILENIHITENVEIMSTSGYVGGIVGVAGGSIRDCYNKGNVRTKQYAGGILGITHSSTGRYVSITNCYNSGKTDANSYKGEIAGQIASSRGETNNCYTKSQVLTNATLGDAFTNDVKIKVMNEETGLEEEVWSNGCFPILKWQIGE